MWFVFSLAQPSTSNGHNSAYKTPQKLIRAPLESPRSQRSNGAKMTVRVVLHAELWLLGVEGETGRTPSAFAPLLVPFYVELK